jgi:hypothetical protein
MTLRLMEQCSFSRCLYYSFLDAWGNQTTVCSPSLIAPRRFRTHLVRQAHFFLRTASQILIFFCPAKQVKFDMNRLITLRQAIAPPPPPKASFYESDNRATVVPEYLLYRKPRNMDIHLSQS